MIVSVDNVSRITLGKTEIVKAYLGEDIVFKKPVLVDINGVEYYQKNYIHISNNQRYDTDYAPNGNCGWETRVYFNTGGNGYQHVLGGQTSYGSRAYGIVCQSNTIRISYNANIISKSEAFQGKIYTIKADKNNIYLNGELLGSGTYTSGDPSIRKFSVGHMNGSVYRSEADMYYCKYWNNGTLVLDLIPAKRVTDGVWGFFNLVNMTFHPSSGGTAFTGG